MGDRTLFELSLAVGTSLDLDEMLAKALGVFVDAMGCEGGAVLFFRGDVGTGNLLSAVAVTPEALRGSGELAGAVRAVESLATGGLQALQAGLPATGRAGQDLLYFTYSLPFIGVLALFRKIPLEQPLLDALPALARRLAVACAACLQASELEMVSRATMSINAGLADSERRLLAMVEDMKSAQEALREGRNYLALILQSLGDGVIVTDDRMNASLMNVRAFEYLEHVPGEGEDLSVDTIFRNTAGGGEAVRALLDPAAPDDSEAELAVNGQHRGERVIRVRKTNLTGLIAGPSGTILLLRDVTREKELDRMKNEFISNLSHELRTPMNAILGISKMLAGRNAANLTGRQSQGLEMIHESGERLLGLINDLLDISKIEAGKMSLRHRPFRTADMVRRIRDVAESLSTTDEVVFGIRVSPAVPDVVITDENRIHQVLVNLVGNSFKFTERGTIGLEVDARGGLLLFTVSDTGIGIDAKDLPFIFERFRQADGSMSRRFPGSGLGLALSRDIVKLLGGEITAESAPGAGTVMRFSAPYRDSCEDVPVPRERQSSPQECSDGRALVLVADDEDVGRETLRLLLGERYRLAFARDGREAFELFSTLRPDLVLMDIMMPDIDGFQALRAVRESPGGQSVPVIAVTARAMRGERERILESGFDGYIAKPVDDALLLNAVEAALSARGKGTDVFGQ